VGDHNDRGFPLGSELLERFVDEGITLRVQLR
jgi:hypothetical protein